MADSGQNLNSFTIGTPATGGALKVYFPENLSLDEYESYITKSITLYNKTVKSMKEKSKLVDELNKKMTL